jgi:hypothetical protein
MLNMKCVQVVVLCLCFWACSDNSSSSNGADGGRSIGGNGAAGSGDATVLFTDGGVPLVGDGGSQLQGDQGRMNGTDQSIANLEDGGMTCGNLSVSAQAATRPVDIVWVIDSSPSMRDEIERVQANLNDFAARIGNSGLDYKVFMIGSDIDLVGTVDIDAPHNHLAICVPPPLSGSASCPDTNSSRYVHVRTGAVVVNGYVAADPVHSADALTVLRNTFPAWRSELRSDARLHVIVVSDDDHRETINRDDLVRLGLPEDFFMHSIINPIDYSGTCLIFDEPNGIDCGCGIDRGRKYIAITEETGGLFLNLCQDDWSPIFQELDEQVNVGEDIPCTFRIPEAPGVAIDFNRVNVDFVGADGTRRPLINVDDCAEDPGGWRYDNPSNPTRILLCPDSCGTLDGDVEVEFGCEIRKR